MTLPAYDRRINPQWPHPMDGPAERARRVALAYRARLARLSAEAAAECDELAARFGETWMLDQPEVDDDQELTTTEAAQLVGVSPGTIRNWACMPHPEQHDRPLLPRYGRRGRERTYLAGHVREADAVMRRAQHARTWSW